MKKTLAVSLTALFLAVTGPALAAENTQQNKMTTCNKDAGDRKGDDRKAFMKECLSAKKMTQQEKMTACNKEATGKKGDDRKAFMKQCLSAS
ncbi:PsiF family protein [Pigmentiphaga kullae]|uniref:PsiF repeat-containing protein n=1 Tax=Pigmentiphaga kullae TaxID=151784 RepID=A0A4Q7ND32_9BURK|nr:PsiF family protein [Pigmentiphaga kullae]RZS80952.1 psiF repeat-containing protein [Pigmentiphaga kullae]